MLVLKRFYGQREIKFLSSWIVLSDRRQKPHANSVFYTSHLINERAAKM